MLLSRWTQGFEEKVLVVIKNSSEAMKLTKGPFLIQLRCHGQLKIKYQININRRKLSKKMRHKT